MFLVPESQPGSKYYWENEYSFDCKSIIMGRTTFEEVLGEDKNKNIDYSNISKDNIEKKDFLSELRKRLNKKMKVHSSTSCYRNYCFYICKWWTICKFI